MKLWQGWHNTDQDRPYFLYGPLGVQRTDGDTVTKTCKRNMKWEMKKPSGSFYLIVEKYVVILFFSLSKNSLLMSCLNVLTDLRNFISAARLFHYFGPR